VEFLRGLGGPGRLLVLTQMAGEVVRTGLEANEASGQTVLTEMVDRILLYKEHHQDLLDVVGVKVPFHYHHLLTVMVFIDLLVLSYGMALSESCLAPCMFLLMATIMIGMMDVASLLWNPFGAHATGFALHQWAQEFLAGVRAILDYEHDGSKEGWKHELQEEHYANIDLQKTPEEVQTLFDRAPQPPPQQVVVADEHAYTQQEHEHAPDGHVEVDVGAGVAGDG
ncbi:unnamed protein product, partial [Symbiodinium pilosum]